LHVAQQQEKARDAEIEHLKGLTLEDQLAGKTKEELDELEDEFDDEDEEEILQRMRDARLSELKAKAAAARFGQVYEISKADWVAEVTEGSKTCWVIAHLYQDSVVECSVMATCLVALAKKFPEVKFVRIRSTQAVENWPDANLPTLFMYAHGALSQQLIGTKALGGVRMQPDDLEWYLAQLGVMKTELEQDPLTGRSVNAVKLQRGGAGAARDSDADSDDAASDGAGADDDYER
jgi:Phosducin